MDMAKKEEKRGRSVSEDGVGKWAWRDVSACAVTRGTPRHVVPRPGGGVQGPQDRPSGNKPCGERGRRQVICLTSPGSAVWESPRAGRTPNQGFPPHCKGVGNTTAAATVVMSSCLAAPSSGDLASGTATHAPTSACGAAPGGGPGSTGAGRGCGGGAAPPPGVLAAAGSPETERYSSRATVPRDQAALVGLGHPATTR